MNPVGIERRSGISVLRGLRAAAGRARHGHEFEGEISFSLAAEGLQVAKAFTGGCLALACGRI